MAKRYWLVCALLTCASAVAGAQAPQTTRPQSPDHPRPPATDVTVRAKHATFNITLTGCIQLENAGGGADGASDEQYLISGVTLKPAKAPSKIAVSSTYHVRGLDRAEVSAHVNHQVELEGQIVAPESARSDGSNDFQATSLKMLSPVCNGIKR